MTKNTTVTVKIDGREPFQFYFDGDGKIQAIKWKGDDSFGKTERALSETVVHMDRMAHCLIMEETFRSVSQEPFSSLA